MTRQLRTKRKNREHKWGQDGGEGERARDAIMILSSGGTDARGEEEA